MSAKHDAIQKLAKRLAEFCVALSFAVAVMNACIGNMSAAMGYASAAMYAICWRISLGTRKQDDGDCDEKTERGPYGRA